MLCEHVSEIQRGEGCELWAGGIDRSLECGACSSHVVVRCQQVSEVVRGEMRDVWVAGVDHPPVGVASGRHVTALCASRFARL